MCPVYEVELFTVQERSVEAELRLAPPDRADDAFGPRAQTGFFGQFPNSGPGERLSGPGAPADGEPPAGCVAVGNRRVGSAQKKDRTVIVEQRGDEIVVRLARVIPETEAWLYSDAEALASLRRGLSQAKAKSFSRNPPKLEAARRPTKRLKDD